MALWAFAPSVIVILLCLWHWYDDIQADKTSQTTVGVLTGYENGKYTYKYSVDGTEYSGEQILKGISPESKENGIRVTYRPEDPSTSTLTPPFGDTDSRPVLMILAALVGLYLYVRLRLHLTREDEDPYNSR